MINKEKFLEDLAKTEIETGLYGEERDAIVDTIMKRGINVGLYFTFLYGYKKGFESYKRRLELSE